MKNMNKNIVSKILITTCLFSLFLFFSCSNLLNNQSDVQNIPQGKGYLVINSGDLTVNRSIDPPSNEEILNSFISFNLSGSGKDANNKSISISSISAGNITELYKKQIILDAGTWSFTLTAQIKNSQLGNINFSSTVSDVLIEAGKNNSVSFNLEPTESYKGNGSLSVKLYLDKNYNKNNIDKVIINLYKTDNDDDDSNDVLEDGPQNVSFTWDGSKQTYYVSYSRTISSKLAIGEYRLVFDFYFDNQILNSIPYIVHIADGVATTYEQTIDLNEIFTITYKGIYDTPKAYIANGQTLVTQYSRKSEDIILPHYNRQDRLFEGWFDENGNRIIKIPHNSNRNYTVTCRWTSLTSGDPVTIYVNPQAEGHYGFSEEYGLASLEAAMETIERVHDWVQTHDWTIRIKGELSGSHVITTEKSNVLEYAKSITLEGISYSTPGGETTLACLNGGYTTATENAAVLSVQIPIPVNIKNLKITGGNNSNTGDIKGGGIYVADGSTVILDDDALITGNSSTEGSGVYVSNNATLQMGGTAQVTNDNDVYLTNGTKILITNQFDGTISHAATITPELYSVENQVLDIASNGSGALENECSVFKVTPQIEGDVTTNWEIDTEGKLALATSPNEFFVDTDGDNENSGLDTENALKTIMAAIDKMNDSASDYVINILGDILQENMSDEYKLELTDSINGKANSITFRGTSNYEINGQAGEDPGTVMKVTTSVPIIIENITVTGGHATPSCLGGAIYIGEDSTVILGEGTIVNGGGDHGCGSAIYVAASENNGVTKAGTLIMKDDAVVNADDYGEIYLCKGATIKVASVLTGESSYHDSNTGEDVTSPIVGKITPQVYEEGTTVIQLSDDTTPSLSISDVYENFEVFKENNTISWTITNEGKLHKASNGGNSNPDDLVYLSGTNGEELTSGTYWDAEGTSTVGNLYVSKTEITQSEYEKYMTYETGYSPADTDEKSTYPAYYVSWCEAIIYCNLRSIDEGLTPYYSMDGETDPTKWTAAGVETSNGKCYLPVANITISNYDTPGNNGMWEPTYVNGGGHLKFAERSTDEGHYGYRLPCGAEWCYIAANSSSLEITDLTTKNVDEWVQAWDEMLDSVGHYHVSGNINGTYNDDYNFSIYDAGGSAIPYYAHESTANIGFRVVRNVE